MTDNYPARTLALLEKVGMSYVIVDEPQGFRSSTPPAVAATSGLAVVRSGFPQKVAGCPKEDAGSE